MVRVLILYDVCHYGLELKWIPWNSEANLKRRIFHEIWKKNIRRRPGIENTESSKIIEGFASKIPKNSSLPAKYSLNRQRIQPNLMYVTAYIIHKNILWRKINFF
jgi:hypothetical protein